MFKTRREIARDWMCVAAFGLLLARPTLTDKSNVMATTLIMTFFIDLFF